MAASWKGFLCVDDDDDDSMLTMSHFALHRFSRAQAAVENWGSANVTISLRPLRE